MGQYLRRELSQGAKWRKNLLRTYTTEPREYLKFNPLPPKTTTRTSLYLGPPRWPATDTFYKEIRIDQKYRSEALRKESAEQIRGFVGPQSVEFGDVVEILTRDGTIQDFGVVTLVGDNQEFNYISIDGAARQDHVARVSFALRGQFNTAQANMDNTDQIKAQLQRIIRAANQTVTKIDPIITAVHSKYAVEDCPRAIDFEEISSCVDKMIPRNKAARSLITDIYKVNRLAIYFALAYHNIYFVRMRRSAFVAVDLKTVHAISKVMGALTRTELEHGAEELMSNHTGAEPPMKDHSIAAMLLRFLEHWSLWNDARLERAVEAVLEECLGHSRSLDSPRALSSALSQVNGISLFPWLKDTTSNPNPSSSASLIRGSRSGPDSVQNSRMHLNSKLTSASPPAESTKLFKARKQHSHLFTTNFVNGCIYLNKSLAIGFDSESYTLSIFIPRITSIPSILSTSSPFSAMPRSTKLNGRVHSLMEPEQVEKYSFKIGKECSSYRMQIRLNRKTHEWDPISATVTAAEIVPIEMPESAGFRKIVQILSTIEPLVSDHELELPPQTENNNESNEDHQLIEFTNASSTTPKLLSFHAQAAAGRIAGLYMQNRQMEGPFLVTSHGREKVSSSAGYHERLDCGAYVAIASPFESGLSLLAQKIIFAKNRLPRMLYQGRLRPPLDTKLQETLIPQLELMTLFEQRDLQYWTLTNLQQQLRASATFQIFRCILLESTARKSCSEGQLNKAFCFDLNIHCEVFVPGKTDQVFSGDQVICTEILELDPLAGLLVVSM